MVKQSSLTRGNVAKMFDINPETLRYYETQKLIKKPLRLHNNYRIYDKEDIAHIHFILKAKKSGLSLKEIQILLNFSLTPKVDREKIRTVIQEKSRNISERIKQLRSTQKALDKLFLLCKQDKQSPECPILNAFSKRSNGSL
ncbi:MerR family transcriptional regulator [Candidatus Dependentiae bacterium]|nr:MerR family transcriptional regulator [Candidatus Dependentiae bacterium]